MICRGSSFNNMEPESISAFSAFETAPTKKKKSFSKDILSMCRRLVEIQQEVRQNPARETELQGKIVFGHLRAAFHYIFLPVKIACPTVKIGKLEALAP